MKILADYHTHSTYSKWYHARHTIDQMAKQANKLGLTELAITDHGPKHFCFGINPKKLDKAKAEVQKANQKYKTNIYLGIEANIIGQDGSIDLSNDQIKKLDILLMGYHKGTKCDFIKYFNKKIRNTPEQIEKNTLAYINAINKYNINIITHLNEYIKVDVARVAQACAQKGTIIELNRKHIRFSEQDAKDLLESGVNFVISSDAHNKHKIANPGDCLEFIKKYNIPLERVKNINGILDFKNQFKN